MRILSWTSVAALIVLGASAAFATTPAFEDNKLNIKACDGSQVDVRWLDDGFTLSTSGKVIGKGTPSFESIGWNGKCQTVSWNKDQRKFAISSDGVASSSALVRFTATDGSRWVGMRDGAGFFVTRIADQDEKPTAARIHEIAEWLKRSGKPAYSPNVKLAEQLKTVDVD